MPQTVGDSPTGGPVGVFPADVAACAPRLRRHATALTGSVADGDDLAQDCMERALAHLDMVRDPARLYSWMLAIMHNIHIGAHRRRRRQGATASIDDLADSLALSVPPGERTAVRDLLRAMAQLTEDQRQILLLSALEGLSYREMADVLDLPLGTVMSRLARARERLRVLLEGGEQQAVRRVK